MSAGWRIEVDFRAKTLGTVADNSQSQYADFTIVWSTAPYHALSNLGYFRVQYLQVGSTVIALGA